MSYKKYKGAAGGWGALKSTTTHLLRSHNVSKNIVNLLRTNQETGFDCPGCAWGEKKDAGRFRFCENGAKAVNWEATSKRVNESFFKSYTVTYLNKQSDYFLESQGRLSSPLFYNQVTDKYQAIGWDEAFALIGQSLNQLDSPNEAEFYTSGRASNEAAFLYQLFARRFGTNNFPDCSNMCHEASGIALTQAIGTGKGTVKLEDFEFADAIFVFGQNPGTNHPRMLETLASAYKRGAKVLVFNNLKERGLERFTNPQKPLEMLGHGFTPTSSHYFMPRLGGDMAVIRGIVKSLLEKDKVARLRGDSIIDRQFIARHTQGYDDYKQCVEQTSWQEIVDFGGLTRHDIEQIADIYQESKAVIVTWAMGLTQHKHSVSTIRELVNLQLMFGNIGKKGAGLCPVRGHSNVQGDRTMGINEKPRENFLTRLGQVFQFSPPRQHGHNVSQALMAIDSKQSKVFISLGGNIIAAAPDTHRVAKAMRQCQLTVSIATKLNRTHVNPGKKALILPCLGRTDKDRQLSGLQKITVEDSFSMVHASMGCLSRQDKDMRSEVAIIAGMAIATLGAHDPIDWQSVIDDYDKIREFIAKVFPEFADVNEKIKSPGGFYLGNSARELNWVTPSGKAQFSSGTLPPVLQAKLGFKALQDNIFLLQTLRSHDQYNTTVYGLDDRYRGVCDQRNVLFVNPLDMAALGLKEGDKVDIHPATKLCTERSDRRQMTGVRIVPYAIAQGNVATYFPEANVLIGFECIGELSDTPTSKSIAVCLSLTAER